MKTLDLILSSIGTTIAVAGSYLTYQQFFYQKRKTRIEEISNVAKNALELTKNLTIEARLASDTFDYILKKRYLTKKEAKDVEQFRKDRRPSIEKELKVSFNLDYILIQSEKKEAFSVVKFVVFVLITFILSIFFISAFLVYNEQEIEKEKIEVQEKTTFINYNV